ncbi:hypothetical protein [Pseudogracilibacillus auburnensis]|uniref:hypothetical protein n=1 Tax=Pseudogracilibacillus auburnensis TaxID=1494959 RepID=UPI001A965734|nr:hypothetical protein [Pseudogracilibacillus auburnensis]MBO1003142.1 hypothetical protein [Pseudogracilibacillus auburnensis]
MTKEEVFQILLDHHIKMDRTKELKGLSLNKFKEIQQKRHWDSYHGFAGNGLWIDYRFKGKTRVQINGKHIFFYSFNEFVKRLYEEIHSKQLSFF